MAVPLRPAAPQLIPRPYEATITSSNFDYYASGTKCEFEWKVQASNVFWNDNPALGRRIIWARCKIGDEVLPNAIDYLPGMNYPFRVQGLRFASNKFPHGPLTITIQAKVAIYNVNTNQDLEFFDLESPPWNVYSYNVASVMATRKALGGGPDPDPDVAGSHFTAPYPAKRITTHAIENTFLPGAGSINYNRRQTTYDAARSMTEPNVLADMKHSTALVYAVHGNWFCFNDSYNVGEAGTPAGSNIGAIQAWSVGAGSYPDEITPCIASKLAESPALPALNLGLFWACSTLSGGSSPSVANPYMPNKLGFTASRTGAAFAGFIGVLQAGINPDTQLNELTVPLSSLTTPMNLHAQFVLDRLKNGDTLEEAVRDANNQYMPRHYELGASSQTQPNPMKIVGDPDTRLVNVYTAITERITFPNWRTSWYHIFF